MPSKNLKRNVKWYESYWVRQYKSKYAATMNEMEADPLVAKDAFQYIMTNQRMKKSEEDRKAMVADIKYYRKRWTQVLMDMKFKKVGPKENMKIVEEVMSQFKSEGKI